MAQRLGIERTDDIDDKFDREVKIVFVNSVITNLERRLEQPEVVRSLAVLDLSRVQPDMQILYGLEEITLLADHFGLDEAELNFEWDSLKNLVFDEEKNLHVQDRSLDALCGVLAGTSFNACYPLLSYLYSVACTLPVSTSEVERLFSAVKLIITDHRASLHVQTVDRLIRVKLNGPDRDNFPFREVALRWRRQKNRRLAA